MHTVSCGSLGRLPTWLLVLILLLGWAPSHPATAEPLAEESTTLHVATKEIPPFILFGAEAQAPTGMTVDLVTSLAGQMGKTVTWHRFTDMNELMQAVQQHEMDMGAAAISVTPERINFVDFSQPYFNASLGVAVRDATPATLWSVFLSPTFLRVVSIWFVILVSVGVLIWLLERRFDTSQLGDRAISGIGDGVWWSAVTMATVGYGDKIPSTFLGRVLAIVWMFISILLISSFTATITSLLTVGQIQHERIKSPQDLSNVKVGTITHTSSSTYLENRGIHFQSFESLDLLLEAIKKGTVYAGVYDLPALRYRVAQAFAGEIVVLDVTFEKQAYALAFPNGSPLRKKFDQKLVGLVASAKWPTLLQPWNLDY